MDEVREHFVELDNRGLPKWIDGDCGNADYKASRAFNSFKSSRGHADPLGEPEVRAFQRPGGGFEHRAADLQGGCRALDCRGL